MKRSSYLFAFTTCPFVASLTLLHLPCAEAQSITQLTAFSCDSAVVCPHGEAPDSLILGPMGISRSNLRPRGSSRDNGGTVFEAGAKIW